MPNSLMAGRADAGQTGLSLGHAGSAAVGREFASVQGMLRPKAWTHSGGMSLEFIDAFNGGTTFRLSGSIGGSETFMAEDLQFGRPQELIRHSFGDDVLNELIEEVDRRRSTALSRGEKSWL